MIRFFLTIILGVVALFSLAYAGLFVWMMLTLFKVVK